MLPAIELMPLMTVPPFEIVNVPLPNPPTPRLTLFVQVEPTPSIKTVPLLSGTPPTPPSRSETVAPLIAVIVPVPV
jgi:hypothetical protein